MTLHVSFRKQMYAINQSYQQSIYTYFVSDLFDVKHIAQAYGIADLANNALIQINTVSRT